MVHGSLFTGIGGFDYAAEMMGWHNEFHCEINPFLRNSLKFYWPNAKSYNDITQTDFTSHRGTIDIISGGFPCQPFSLAGKQKGTEDSRHLWPAMLRAIREIKPRWVVGENVRGIVSWNAGMVFEQVHSDLEAEGYEVQAFVLPIAGINAPHRRERVWFVGYSKHNVTNTTGIGCNIGCNNRQERPNKNDQPFATESQPKWDGWELGTCKAGTLSTNPTNNRCDGGTCERCDITKRHVLQDEQGRSTPRCEASGCSGRGIFTDPNGSGFKKFNIPNKSKESGFNARLYNEEFDYWQNFPIESPICSGDDGFSSRLDRTAVFAGIKHTKRKSTYTHWRNESIKAYGNAIGPHVALQIFQAIQQYENNSHLWSL